MKKLKKEKGIMTEEEYAKKDGMVCPVCHSRNISSDAIQTSDSELTADVSCLDCEATWTDSYKLSGYSNLTVMFSKPIVKSVKRFTKCLPKI